MLTNRNAAVALLVMTLSTSACEFFTTKPFAPDFSYSSYVEVPNALAKYAPGLPPNLYARANAVGVSLSTGSFAGDAMAGLRLSAAPLSPLAVDLASVTPAAWVPEMGTGLQYIDDDTTPQALPFSFSFYGQTFSSVYVSANGHISFGSPINFKRTWNIPDGAFVLAAPAYADWMPASRFSFPNLQNSRVFVNTVGEPGDRRFVVTWNDMRPCCSLSYPGSSFQVQLLERTGEVVFAYREMQMIVSNASAGIAAAANHMRVAAGAAVLGLQGCVITYTPISAGYREANSCAPEPVNVPPVVEVGGPYVATEGQTVELNGSATDENGDALTYTWALGDGTNLNGNPVSHTFVDDGAYPATLAVSDGDLVTLVTTRVDVSNALPSLSALEGATRFIGEAYDVSLTISDAGVLDAPWHYTIEWGDGTVDEADATSLSEPIRGSHSYVEAGTYTVRVALRDKDEGAATSVEAQVVVKLDETDIDVKPWDSGNRIHLKGHWDKHIVVAILADERLDAAAVDLATVKLGNVSIRQVHRTSERGTRNLTYLATLFDVDRDGDRDLLVLFDRKEMLRAGDLTPETTGLTLTGMTVGGTRKIVGTDAIQIVK
ncbi:MAG TPA: PKD domain-containing protein [Gemmatimonadaceae bacterium]|nr:PKD domain-containing protein [Gemmatimonadaceae bacterium]